MLATALDAKARLEEEGLHVSCNSPHSLWIAVNVRDVGEGILLSHDACALAWKAGQWVAIFPAEGLLTFEVPGSLSELVPLITAICADYRRGGGTFTEAVKRVVPDVGQFLVDRTPASV